MAAPQAGGGGQSDNSTGILWGIAAIFAFLGGIWFVFKTQLVSFYLLVKYYELHLIDMVAGHRYTSLKNMILAARQNAGDLSFDDVLLLGGNVGNILRYPFAAIMIVLAFIVYFGNTTRVYKRTYNMKELAKLERDNWPQINPTLPLDLIKTDIDTGPWAMALTPMQFCKRHHLLQEMRPDRREGMPRSEWDKINVVLRRGEANQLFVMQLGQLFAGPDRLPPYARALFAAFAARLNADKDGIKIITQLADSSSGSLNMSGVDALLKKHYSSKLVQARVRGHAYVLTVMAAMLEAAREDGVQATADFLWLKPVDRRLWYTLNTVGRQTPFVEVAGVFAHWVAEKEAGHRLVMPMVEEATNALELAIREVVYRPDD
ncbi:MAG TPA: type IVB secretion system coupling complex protein DotM/IcmP [Gammaproteobacteria bacterium]|nr:type IVB secretion system coupling complex protein DotM/IcmP [Gammaproteobacteria bacterium]